MRYDCTIPGFENNFVEVSENWTRGDVRKYFALKGDEYMEFIRSKVVAIHLEMSDGVIDSPDKFTNDNIDNVHLGVWRWVGMAIQKGVDDLYALGEANARRSLGVSAN